MLELIISKDELVEMFDKGDIEDSNDGWIYKDEYLVSIIALHEQNPKYIYDITDSQYYKIIAITNN
jgi:hypothetical protein